MPSLSGDGDLPLEEMIARFSLERVNKTAAIYDTEKLTSMNGHYLREGNLGLPARLCPFCGKGLVSPNPGKDELGKLQKVVSRCAKDKTLSEMAGFQPFLLCGLRIRPPGLEKHFQRRDRLSNRQNCRRTEALPDSNRHHRGGFCQAGP